MAYDERLAERIRDLSDGPGLTERRMFGGLCFLLDGNMCFGVIGERLMVRVGVEGYADALAQPHAQEMDFTGRVSRGMVYVDEAGTADDGDLARWLARGAAYARSRPPK